MLPGTKIILPDLGRRMAERILVPVLETYKDIKKNILCQCMCNAICRQQTWSE